MVRGKPTPEQLAAKAECSAKIKVFVKALAKELDKSEKALTKELTKAASKLAKAAARAANSGARARPPWPANFVGFSPVEFAWDLLEVTDRRPPWLTGSYHPRPPPPRRSPRPPSPPRPRPPPRRCALTVLNDHKRKAVR